MPQQAWSKKRERQYEKIKDSLLDQGRSESTAEEIASRTVNKERARTGRRQHLLGRLVLFDGAGVLLDENQLA